MAKKSSGKQRNSKFNDLVRDRLEGRFALFLQYGSSEIDYSKATITFGKGANTKTIALTDNREVWYHTVDEFKAKYPGEEIDISENNRYKILTNAINKFCEGKINKHREELAAINPRLCVHYGILRKAMGVLAKERAKSFGFSVDRINAQLEKNKKINDVAVTDKTRPIFKDSALMAVICEKEMMAVKWLIEMKRRGWKGIDMISSEGFSVAEVMEMVYDLHTEIEKGHTSFQVGVLHDLDAPGILIIHSIRRFFPNVLDLGVNFDFLDELLPGYWDQYAEDQKVTKDQRTALAERGYADVIARLGDRRLEINNLDARRGMGPLADWAERQIEENCYLWDLNRVAVPSYRAPTEYCLMRDIMDTLWETLVTKITQKSPANLFQNPDHKARLKEIIEANRHYEASPSQIKEYPKIIEAQSKELRIPRKTFLF